jgi:hypothetical protein
MKKFLYILFLIIISSVNSFAFLFKPFDNKSGVFIGYVNIILSSSHNNVNSGTFIGAGLNVKDKSTGEIYKISSEMNGYYYKVNLKPGLYEIVSFDYKIESKNMGIYSFLDTPVVDKENQPIQIIFGVHEKTITIIKPIVIIVKITQKEYDNTAYFSQWIEREDVTDKIIKTFKDLDTKKYYQSYIIEELEL